MVQEQTAQPPPIPGVSRPRRKSRGQSLVEFALITPVLVLILAISADFGRAFSAYIGIASAAREGASYGMQSTTNSTDCAGIRTAAAEAMPAMFGVSPSPAVCATGVDAYNYRYVQVTVSYTFTPIIRVPPIPNSLTMSRTVRMRVIQ